MSFDVIEYRKRAANRIPNEIGVYALCDLDEVPIYVGQSVDGIRARVRRHITSARSDIIANRQVDVWEIAYVWAWPVERDQKDIISVLEAYLFHVFHGQSPLMNGSIPSNPGEPPFLVQPPIKVQLLPDEEITNRKRIEVRLPRQASHFTALLDHFLNVKDSKELHLALQAHFQRLSRYFAQLKLDG